MPFKPAQVEIEYAKDENLKKEDVASLLEWAEKQAHLPKIDELEAILFLQSCYYRNEVAKNAMDDYFTVRTLCPDMLGCVDVKDASLLQAMKTTMITMLPKETPEGYKVIFIRLLDSDPDNFSFIMNIRHFDALTILNLHLNGPCNGFVIVFDMVGTAFGHLLKLNPIVLKKFLFYLQEAMPIRLRGVHYINTVPLIDKIMTLMKPFLKKELMDVIYIHTSAMDDFYKAVPKDLLPQELGGNAESFEILQEKSKRVIVDNADFFKFYDNLVVNETKRVGKPKNVGDFFGVEGTFKQLQID